MSDVEAGKAHITTWVDNSQLVKGFRAAQNAFSDFGSRLTAIGARLTGVGDVLGLTLGKEMTSKIISVFAGATLGTAIAAPVVVAFSNAFKGGAFNNLFASLLQLAEQVSLVVEEIAKALLPPILATSRIVTGIVSLTARWLANHKALVGSTAQIAGGIATVGATLAIIGKVAEGLGSGFGFAAKAVAALGTFLASPLGIAVAIGAAVAGGVAAWMRFTDSGRAAAKMLYEFFAPAIDFIKQLVGGIGDSLAAGNLQLAGQIALKGLQLVFAEGINTIADLLGGTLGDAVGQLGQQLISGDLVGAWQTIVASMGKLWASFSQGVVKVFSAAAQAVVSAWSSAVSGIANSLLKASAQGGVLGKIASTIVGADVGKLQAENDRLDRARGIKQDIFGIGAQSINDSTKAIADPIKGFLTDLETFADDTAAKADQKLKATVKAGERVDTGSLQKQLDELTTRAAKERAGIKDLTLPEKQDFGSVAVGFGGGNLALQLQGGAGGPQKQMADQLKKQTDLQQQLLDTFNSVKAQLAKLGFQ